jgi:hypothetical protein
VKYLVPLLVGVGLRCLPWTLLVSTIRWGLSTGLPGTVSIQFGAFVGKLPCIAVAVAGSGGLATLLPTRFLGVVGAVVLILATDPVALAFWISAAAGLISGRHLDNVPLALGGFLAGNVACAAALAVAVGVLHRPAGPRLWRGVSCGNGAMLIVTGLLLAHTSLI